MKKLILTCAIVTCGTVLSFGQNNLAAQQNPNGNAAESNAVLAQRDAASKKQMAEHMAQRQTKEMQQKFNLTEEQYKKAYDANVAYMTKVIEKRNPANAPMTPAENQMFADERDVQLKKIMNTEQFEKYQTSKRNMPVNSPQPNR